MAANVAPRASPQWRVKALGFGMPNSPSTSRKAFVAAWLEKALFCMFVMPPRL